MTLSMASFPRGGNDVVAATMTLSMASFPRGGNDVVAATMTLSMASFPRGGNDGAAFRKGWESGRGTIVHRFELLLFFDPGRFGGCDLLVELRAPREEFAQPRSFVLVVDRGVREF